MRRTKSPKWKMTDWQGLPARSSRRKTKRFAIHKKNPAGSKIGFHGGELSVAAFNRNNPFPVRDYAEYLRRLGINA